MAPPSRPAGSSYGVVHEDKYRLCLYCDFRWMPPSTVRDHLEKCHPDVDPDVILHQADSTRRLCMYCDVEWNHTYEYKDHLREHHPNIDPDAVLGEAPWSQHRDKIIARFTTTMTTRTGHGLCRYPRCTNLGFFDGRINEYREWCSDQHMQDAIRHRVEKPCSTCNVWPRRNGRRQCSEVCRSRQY